MVESTKAQKGVYIDHQTTLEAPMNGEYLVTFSGQITLIIRNHNLIVPPFQIKKYKQIFINSAELTIDLRVVKPGRYRVIAVHNFQTEDRNPNLNECLGGIFLAAHLPDGTWEEPESFPVECRQLGVLGYIIVGDVHSTKL